MKHVKINMKRVNELLNHYRENNTKYQTMKNGINLSKKSGDISEYLCRKIAYSCIYTERELLNNDDFE